MAVKVVIAREHVYTVTLDGDDLERLLTVREGMGRESDMIMALAIERGLIELMAYN